MIHPRRIDHQHLRVVTIPSKGTFVDANAEYDRHGKLVGRGGPEYSRHYCRFEDYGLADGLVRCRKCGLVRQSGNP